MNKNVKYYERILKKMIIARNKKFDEWLEPQLHAAALCWQMLEKVQEEILGGKLVTEREGSKEQKYGEANPLFPTYKELQRTITLHYEALGLNMKARTQNVKDATTANDSEEHSAVAQYYKGRKK